MPQADEWLRKGWVDSSAKRVSGEFWRAVEAQHVVATMQLVDSLDEQAVLEELLEASKPPVPDVAQGLDFLLSTPYRYPSACESRFRKSHELGIWYGASDTQTACAEVAYWRWRFFMDSEGLRTGKPIQVELTLFAALVNGLALTLYEPPWVKLAALWADIKDYRHCHQLAAAARRAKVEWIGYASVRHAKGTCAAVLRPLALKLRGNGHPQTWYCKVSETTVLFSRSGACARYEFPQGISSGKRRS